jgi:hypothetical protein
MFRSFVFASALLTAAPALAQTAAPATPAPPPCSSPEYRQMDFWVGDWDIRFNAGNGQTGKASNHVTRDEYGSCVISEHFAVPAIGSLGGSYSIYDGRRKVWRQTWVDNSGSVFVLEGGPVTGKPYVFELRTLEKLGTDKAIRRMIWEKVTPDSLTWRWQAENPDGAWRDLWVLDYVRRKSS